MPAQALADLMELVRVLLDRVTLLEQRSPGRDPFPQALVSDRLQRLERAVNAAGNAE
jgi:hypothetical protein